MIHYDQPIPTQVYREAAYPHPVQEDAERSRPRLVGEDQEAPLVTGEFRRHVNLDFAASAPPLVEVLEAVNGLLPWYSSVHRGAGFKSRASTAAYERSRAEIASFFGARPDDTLIFTRHTTEALNLLANCLPAGARVLATEVEHHANMLPWRRAQVQYLPIPAGPAAFLHSLDQTLAEAGGAIALVAVTGASNVTGEIWPLADIVKTAHRHGARVVVDAAQLAPHAPIDITALGIDYLALSGHKLYAPFGIGVLIGRADWLADAEPAIQGGGAVASVTIDDVIWRGLPDRHEAGTPNLVGVVALAAACRTLSTFGMDRVAAEEADLYRYAQRLLSAVPGLDLYTLWDHTHAHIGVFAFNLRGYVHGRLAAILSAEYGISVRAGSFCAHPFVQHLINGGTSTGGPAGCTPEGSPNGAVRLSMGISTTREDIDYTVEALKTIAAHGPAWQYQQDPKTGEHLAVPDPRILPDL
jgi:selenocysteine lyase/cysteine desulfurase